MALYDDMQIEKCANAAPMSASLGQYIPPSDRQKLQQKKMALEGELARVEAALSALDAHPDLEEFVKTLQAGLR